MYNSDSGANSFIHRYNWSRPSVFTESVSLRDIGKATSRAGISSPSSLYFKAVRGAAHNGPALMISIVIWNSKLIWEEFGRPYTISNYKVWNDFASKLLSPGTKNEVRQQQRLQFYQKNKFVSGLNPELWYGPQIAHYDNFFIMSTFC